ncbi:WD40-repeat-containing domain protein [Mycena haematopus]|nr:WD40-repeat-containing domain protein [Mycena haematopus]
MSYSSSASQNNTEGHQPSLRPYLAAGVLPGHQGSVTCLQATEDGRLLASGGTDGVKIWDLQKMRMVRRPTGVGSRGATSALLWIRREDHPGEILAYGTQTGLVVCWRQTAGTFEEVNVFQLAELAEITGLAFDSTSNRLAVCHRQSVIQVHELDEKLNPDPVFSIVIKNFLPKALSFAGELKGKQKELLAFGFHDGKVLTLNAETGEVIRSRQIGSMIGSADYNQRRGVFCIDDPFQGTVLYRADTETRVRTFEVKLTKPSPRPRQVCFADDCSSVVSGSDHGVVYIFDRRSGETVDTLRIDANDWVQTVTATQVDGISTIIAARSRDWGGSNTITVWKKKSSSSGRRLWEMILGLNIVVLCVAMVFLYRAKLGI